MEEEYGLLGISSPEHFAQGFFYQRRQRKEDFMNVTQKPVSLARNEKVHSLALDGILAALGVVLMLLVRVPLLPAAPWLIYDMGDIPAMIGGLILGPAHGLLILAVVCIVQMVTPVSSGLYGLIMHFVASGILVLIPALMWKMKKSQPMLVVSLLLAAAAMTAIMIPLNLVVTPIFLGVTVDEVMPMILPILLPFNAIKGLINAIATFIVFQSVKGLARKYFG
jgi:riboflavin transporter FmnP